MTDDSTSQRLSFAAAYHALGAAKKGVAAGAPAYSVFINRPLGRVFAAALYRAGWLPNAVTVLSGLITAAGIVLLAVGPVQAWLGPAVWLLLAIGYALDSSDGQLARLRGGGSLAGEWLDHVIDASKIPALHLAVLIFLWRLPERGGDAILLVPIVYSLVASTTFFAMILNDQLKRSAGVAEAVSSGGSSPLRSVLLLPTDYGVFCAVFLLLGAPALFTPVYVLFFVVNTLFLVLALLRWFRVMRAVDRNRLESDHA